MQVFLGLQGFDGLHGYPATLSLPGSALLWARSSVGVTADGADNLTALQEQTANGNHVNVISGTAPTVVTGAGGVQAIELGGASQYFGRTDLVGGPRGAASTMMLVFSVTSTSGTRVLCQTNPTTDSGAQRIQIASDKYGIFAGSLAEESGATADTGLHCAIATYDGAGQGDLWVDGVKIISAGTVGTNNDDGWGVGRTSSGMPGGSHAMEHGVWSGVESDDRIADTFALMKSLHPSLPALP